MINGSSYTPPLLQEHLLLDALANGSRDAYNTLYRFYQPRLIHSILPFADSSDTAEEVVQEVLFKLWSRRETLLGIESLEKYLMRSTRNQLLDHRKKETIEHRYRGKVPISAPGSPAWSAEDELSYKEYVKVAWSAIAQLPEKQREVFLLRQRRDLTAVEIADEIGTTPEAVRKNLSRATQFVRDYLKAHSEWLGLFLILLGSR